MNTFISDKGEQVIRFFPYQSKIKRTLYTKSVRKEVKTIFVLTIKPKGFVFLDSVPKPLFSKETLH